MRKGLHGDKKAHIAAFLVLFAKVAATPSYVQVRPKGAQNSPGAVPGAWGDGGYAA